MPHRVAPPASAGLPVHVVPSGPDGGIQLLTRQLVAAAGAPLLTGTLAELDRAARERPPEPWHLHFSDRLFGADAGAAAGRIRSWARLRPVTVTLHDVPQAWAPEERQRCYLAVVATVRGWAANSHHEVLLVQELAERHDRAGRTGSGRVFHLPVFESAPSSPTRDGSGPVSLGVLGWIYPDKGHREVVRAAARLRRSGCAVRVALLGSPVRGHEDLLAELHRRAERADVELTVTGFVPDAELELAMGRVDVPVAGHQHLSASASINSWIGVGRRPLVADGRYARELAALRPGTVTLYDGHDPEGVALDEAVATALRDHRSTWWSSGAQLAPGLRETAAAYRAWWASATYDGPQPSKPAIPSW